jgi:VanZ family protein
VALALLLLGVATELVQLLVPGRHARVSDVAVDLGAGLLGWLAIRAMTRKES